MSKMKRLRISMDNELLSALERYAKEVDMTKAEVVRACLLAEFGPHVAKS
jgi:metal-responsive CopG/Arc/MetJ family transcriptional regulator